MSRPPGSTPGPTRKGSRDGSRWVTFGIRRAGRHFTIATTGALLVMALLLVMGITMRASGTSDVSDTWLWTALLLSSVLGALIERAYAIGYHGFKVKDYEPMAWRYHLAVGLRAALVALALVAMGEMGTHLTIRMHLPLLLAFGFGAGYFGESVFAVFERRFRSLIGNPPTHRLPVRDLVGGIDLPLSELADERLAKALDEPPEALVAAVHALRGHGLAYTHDLVGTARTGSGRAWLSGAGPDAQAKLIDKLVVIADLARAGLDVKDAVRIAELGIERAEDLDHPGTHQLVETKIGDPLPPRVRRLAQEIRSQGRHR